MNQIILSVMLLFASSTLVLAQSDKEQAVRQTLDKVQAALRSNDADAYAPLLADDYTFVNPQGIMINKTQRVESIRSAQVKFESFAYNDVKIRLYGNTAVVNAKAGMKYSGGNADTVLVTMMFVKKTDQWQLVAAQATSPAK